MTFTDSKGRAWTVTDRRGLGEFDRECPIGSDLSLYRIFSLPDHVRAYMLTPGDVRALTPADLYRQLRRSWRTDQREHVVAAKHHLQELYDRRGMGRR